MPRLTPTATRSGTSLIGERVVVDASALVDLLRGGALGSALAARLERSSVHAPAHLDVEVLSVLGRMHRAGAFTAEQVAERLEAMTTVPLIRHPLAPLLLGAWGRRASLRLADAVYVELADRLDVPLITTDRRLARATPRAQLPGG